MKHIQKLYFIMVLYSLSINYTITGPLHDALEEYFTLFTNTNKSMDELSRQLHTILNNIPNESAHEMKSIEDFMIYLNTLNSSRYQTDTSAERQKSLDRYQSTLRNLANKIEPSSIFDILKNQAVEFLQEPDIVKKRTLKEKIMDAFKEKINTLKKLEVSFTSEELNWLNNVEKIFNKSLIFYLQNPNANENMKNADKKTWYEFIDILQSLNQKYKATASPNTKQRFQKPKALDREALQKEKIKQNEEAKLNDPALMTPALLYRN